jgi:hypothetical protein
MKRDYYEVPEPSQLMRFFWKAAGGDPFILRRSTYSDQIKYMCLGGIIVATGLMAAFAGGYAFYTIFETKGSAIDQHLQIGTLIIALFFGAGWGLMIFNLDRFIVSSTGKGDGTEAITWNEIKGALPRIIMGAIIALTISKPVEIRMFKSEIDAALHEEQLKLRKDYETRTRVNYDERLKLVQGELDKFDTERASLQTRINKAEGELTDQLQGRAGAGAGDGKLSQALRGIKDNLTNELSTLDERNKPRVDELSTKKASLIQEMDSELGKNVVVANGLDGLLERIKLAHETAGFWISFFITMLFMAIELTPIFFKLMLVKSPYDYLKDNIEQLIKAEEGIHVEPNYYKDKNGQERDLITYLKSEKALINQKGLFDVQKRLSEFALEHYEADMKRKIAENPDNFIITEDNGFLRNGA